MTAGSSDDGGDCSTGGASTARWQTGIAAGDAVEMGTIDV